MKQVNRLLKVALMFILSFAVAIPVVNADGKKAAYRSKDEVVYGTLTAKGASEAAYVVNVFEVTNPGEIIDYGSYSEVKNLTDLSNMTINSDSVKLNVDKGKFYYQGDLESVVLPWDFTVRYYLDDQEISPEELLGKDGNVKINIQSTADETVDPMFFEHYTLQLTVPLDVERFSNIQAEDATIANAGKMEQVTFTVLPGDEADLTVTANVSDFELDGIDIVAIPFMMALDDFETDGMVDDFSALSDAIAELHDGVGKLNKGIHQLNDGTTDLFSGSQQFKQGLNELNRASNPLVNGSNQINDVLNMIEDELAFIDMIDVTEISELPFLFDEISSEFRQAADDLEKLKDENEKSYNELKKAVDAIPKCNKKIELT